MMWPESKRLNIWVFVSFLCIGCLHGDGHRELRAAEALVKKERFVEALSRYDRVIKRYQGENVALQAARHASRISVYNLKDYASAINHYRYIVLHSTDERERFEAQNEIANVYYELLADYEQAIVEYSRLLQVTKEEKEKIHFRKLIARSYFFRKNFFQAETEINQINKSGLDEENVYDILFFRANIKMATKNIAEAIEILSDLLERYPERAHKDNVALHLAICYEEKENFARAIEVLDSLRPESGETDYIGDQIKRLKQRQSFLPGAKGLTK